MDTEEMYRRGIADAERGEPHPFYYEHYYQYRRGYDRARRRRGLPGGFYDIRRRRLTRFATVVVVLAAIAGGYWLWRGRSQSLAVATDTNQLLALPATAESTHTPIFPTPTTQPSPTPLALQVGGSAKIVNIAGSVLRSRKQPTLKAPATASFKEGELVRILEGPVEADGFVWWKIEGDSGSGWSAQQSKDGQVWLQPIAAS